MHALVVVVGKARDPQSFEEPEVPERADGLGRAGARLRPLGPDVTPHPLRDARDHRRTHEGLGLALVPREELVDEDAVRDAARGPVEREVRHAVGHALAPGRGEGQEEAPTRHEQIGPCNGLPVLDVCRNRQRPTVESQPQQRRARQQEGAPFLIEPGVRRLLGDEQGDLLAQGVHAGRGERHALAQDLAAARHRHLEGERGIRRAEEPRLREARVAVGERPQPLRELGVDPLDMARAVERHLHFLCTGCERKQGEGEHRDHGERDRESERQRHSRDPRSGRARGCSCGLVHSSPLWGGWSRESSIRSELRRPPCSPPPHRFRRRGRRPPAHRSHEPGWAAPCAGHARAGP